MRKRMKGVLMEYDYSSSNNIDTEGQASLIYIHTPSHPQFMTKWTSNYFLRTEDYNDDISKSHKIYIYNFKTLLRFYF